MTYQTKDFQHLLGLPGFSDTMLTNHFTLYAGYVTNVNTLDELLKTAKAPESSELRRRYGWEWSGMRLHELYFGNMTLESKAVSPDSAIYKAITSNFDSYEAWEAGFRAMALTRGIGWVALVRDKNTDRLINIWIGEHDMGQLVGTDVLLIMDVWEHSYMTDYGIKRPGYVDAFMQAIDWNVVEKRLVD